MIKSQTVRWTLRLIVCNVCIAATVPLFKWAFGTHVTLPWLVNQYLVSFIYTNCIGLLLNALAPPFWKGSQVWSPSVRWSARAVFLITVTAAGCSLGTAFCVATFSGWQYWSEAIQSFKIALPIAFVALAFSVLYD